jgi:Transposase IS116/IS110/IS902 family.
VLIAEVGVDRSAFPSAAQLAAWAGVCPGNNERAGRRYSARARKGCTLQGLHPARAAPCKGNVHLRTAKVSAAQCAARKKAGYLRDKCYRLKSRRGYKRPAMAVAHKLLIAAYHVLASGQPLQGAALRRPGRWIPGSAQRSPRHPESGAPLAAVRRLQRLGYEVKLEKACSLQGRVTDSAPVASSLAHERSLPTLRPGRNVSAVQSGGRDSAAKGSRQRQVSPCRLVNCSSVYRNPWKFMLYCLNEIERLGQENGCELSHGVELV